MNAERLAPSLRKHQAGAFFSVVILLLAGCASSRVPPAISEAPEKPVLVQKYNKSPPAFSASEYVGAVPSSWSEMGSAPPRSSSSPARWIRGEPRKEPGEGRFIALLRGFADPTEYPEKRLFTITGRLERVETRPIGEYPYPYPVVTVEQSHLWPEPSPRGPSYFYPHP